MLAKIKGLKSRGKKKKKGKTPKTLDFWYYLKST